MPENNKENFPILSIPQQPNLSNEFELAPIIIKCRFCGKKLMAKVYGKFRCPGCKKTDEINKYGEFVNGDSVENKMTTYPAQQEDSTTMSSYMLTLLHPKEKVINYWDLSALMSSIMGSLIPSTQRLAGAHRYELCLTDRRVIYKEASFFGFSRAVEDAAYRSIGGVQIVTKWNKKVALRNFLWGLFVWGPLIGFFAALILGGFGNENNADEGFGNGDNTDACLSGCFIGMIVPILLLLLCRTTLLSIRGSSPIDIPLLNNYMREKVAIKAMDIIHGKIEEDKKNLPAREDRVQEADEKSKNVCPNCSKHVDSSWKRCPHCEFKLKETCLQCGKPIEPTWTICPYCEAQLY